MPEQLAICCMDELDQRLISLLRADSRAPTATLAKALKVSRGTVQNRMERLESGGVLLGYTVRVSASEQAQRVRAIMSIAIEGGASTNVQRALRGIPAVATLHTTNGRWDMVAELVTPDLAAFSAALDDIRAISGIAATETSLLLKTTQF